MLYWHFRNLHCMLYGLFGSRLADPRAKIARRFWANPFDSDWMNSVQAGRYFTYTDAARWELAGRLGFFKPIFRSRSIVFVGSQKIIHRKPVRLFRTFELSMRFAGWDEKWIYAAHEFSQDGELKALTYSKIGIKSRNRLVDPSHVFAELGYERVSRPEERILGLFTEDAGYLEAAKSGG